jgi:hypothetical protein
MRVKSVTGSIPLADIVAATPDYHQLLVKPRRAAEMLACSVTKIYMLMDADELVSFKDGYSRKITVASIRAYIGRKLGAAQPGKAA